MTLAYIILAISVLLAGTGLYNRATGKAERYTDAGCDALAYVFFGALGTILCLSYIFGGGIS